MLFNSIDFGIFFPAVFFLYWLVFNKSIKLRNIFLIAVSYLFYGWWDWRFLSLIVISSLIDYFVGHKIEETDQPKTRKKWLYLSLLVNLGFLGFFKYYNFFIDSFIGAFSFMGTEMDPSRLNIILPVGISFYTFQTLSYTLDIYYKKLKPTNNIFAFFAFVSFFPQLVAGPIERAKDLLPQFFEKRTINYNLLRSGILLMAWGFFKKIVIADRLAIYVDNAYGNIENLDGVSSVFAVIFFAFQLYLDFSAYSDIAIGSSRMLGFKLSINFKRPYLSSSFSNFWKRWHISLSSWFKDYVYIPLGGNRVSKTKMMRNLLIVFVLSGLWHGASWNFVIWGFLNGLFIIVLDRFIPKTENKIFRAFISFGVSVFWAVSLIFFRARTFNDAITMFSKLTIKSKDLLYEHGLNASEFGFTIKLLIAYMIIELIIERYNDVYSWFITKHFALRWASYFIAILIILFLGSYGVGLNDNNFIYFQF